MTADVIPDQQVRDLWLSGNGDEKQRCYPCHTLFKVDQVNDDISTLATLEPGDRVGSGGSEGPGPDRTPQEELRPGDVAAAESMLRAKLDVGANGPDVRPDVFSLTVDTIAKSAVRAV